MLNYMKNEIKNVAQSGDYNQEAFIEEAVPLLWGIRLRLIFNFFDSHGSDGFLTAVLL